MAEPGSPLSPLAADEREATILLQVDDVVVNEVKGSQRVPLDKGDMTVLKIAATEEELQQLGAAMAATEFATASREVVFVVVGEHKIPVIKNVPVLRKEPHKYTFVMPGLFLEISMPDDVDDEEIEVLELLLRQNGVLRVKGAPIQKSTVVVDTQGERTAPPPSVGDRISEGITKAGGKIVDGIATATPKVQGKIEQGSDFACSKLTPNAQPAEIKDSTVNNIKKTKMATKTAVLVSGQMAGAMVALAKTLGTQLSGFVTETSAGQQASENETVTEVKKVAVTGVVTAATILDSGTEALKEVLKTTCTGLSTVVGHKYGENAGEACGEGLEIVQDVAQAASNINKVGIKGLAKVAGKEAAKNIVSDNPAPASSSSNSAPQ